MEGYIKLHRKMLKSVVSTDPILAHVWVQLLLRTNYETRQLRNGQTLQAGQLMIGQERFSKEIGCSRQNVRTALKSLEKCENLTTQPTRHGTLVTIKNWATYQTSNGLTNRTANQNLTRSQPESNQNLTTEEEGKKERREEGEKVSMSPNGDGKLSVDEFVARWNRFCKKRSKLKQVRKITDARRKKLSLRLKDPDWLNAFYVAIECIPFSGDGWQPNIDWFVRNETNVFRISEGEFDWRNEDDPGLQRLQAHRRKLAAEQREKLVEQEKRECQQNAAGTKKAIDAILSQSDGNEQDCDGSEWLFGSEEDSSANAATGLRTNTERTGKNRTSAR